MHTDKKKSGLVYATEQGGRFSKFQEKQSVGEPRLGKVLPFPMGLRHWCPSHGHDHVNGTHPLRTSFAHGFLHAHKDINSGQILA